MRLRGEGRRPAVDSVRMRLGLHRGEVRRLPVGSVQPRLVLYRERSSAHDFGKALTLERVRMAVD